jgi:ribosome-associated toxin RatA of RatAB toxin-antitoxin module
VDWSAPENLILREKRGETNGTMKLEYWSLVDTSCKSIYDALQDLEHYPEFIPGIDNVQVIGRTDNTKTVLITQRVLSRHSNAKVEWTFDPARPQVSFKTLTSDFAYNEGEYQFETSPDGKRCLVKTAFQVKSAPGVTPVALNVLAQATRESFLKASEGVKKRAAGGAK